MQIFILTKITDCYRTRATEGHLVLKAVTNCVKHVYVPYLSLEVRETHIHPEIPKSLICYLLAPPLGSEGVNFFALDRLDPFKTTWCHLCGLSLQQKTIIFQIRPYFPVSWLRRTAEKYHDVQCSQCTSKNHLYAILR